MATKSPDTLSGPHHVRLSRFVVVTAVLIGLVMIPVGAHIGIDHVNFWVRWFVLAGFGWFGLNAGANATVAEMERKRSRPTPSRECRWGHTDCRFEHHFYSNDSDDNDMSSLPSILLATFYSYCFLGVAMLFAGLAADVSPKAIVWHTLALAIGIGAVCAIIGHMLTNARFTR